MIEDHAIVDHDTSTIEAAKIRRGLKLHFWRRWHFGLFIRIDLKRICWWKLRDNIQLQSWWKSHPSCFFSCIGFLFKVVQKFGPFIKLCSSFLENWFQEQIAGKHPNVAQLFINCVFSKRVLGILKFSLLPGPLFYCLFSKKKKKKTAQFCKLCIKCLCPISWERSKNSKIASTDLQIQASSSHFKHKNLPVEMNSPGDTVFLTQFHFGVLFHLVAFFILYTF